MKEFRIAISPDAQRDILAIRDHISQFAPDRALEYYDFLLDRIRDLKVFPSRYPVDHSLTTRGHEIRVRPVGEYRLLYSVRSRSIRILRVRHGARGTMRSLSD